MHVRSGAETEQASMNAQHNAGSAEEARGNYSTLGLENIGTYMLAWGH